eukprot:5242390-Amphidinium_carterae.1
MMRTHQWFFARHVQFFPSFDGVASCCCLAEALIPDCRSFSEDQWAALSHHSRWVFDPSMQLCCCCPTAAMDPELDFVACSFPLTGPCQVSVLCDTGCCHLASVVCCLPCLSGVLLAALMAVVRAGIG